MFIQKVQDKNKQLLEKEANMNELDLFFKTIAVTAKKLLIKKKLEAKIKIFAFMNELEEKYLVTEQLIHSSTI